MVLHHPTILLLLLLRRLSSLLLQLLDGLVRVLLVAAVGLDLQIPEKKISQQNPFWSIEKGSPKNAEQAGPTYSALAITRQTLVPLALALLLLFQLLLLQLLGFFGAGLVVCA